MILKLRYLLGAVVSIPLLPLLYLQGKKVRKSVPLLPEAEGIEGIVDSGSDRTLNILTIGESTIAGVGVDKHENGFTGLLAKRLSELLLVNVHWKVYARSGYTAKRVKSKIIPKITEDQVDLLVVGLGGNDAFTLNKPWKWKKEVEALIQDLKSKFPGTPIAFTNMPPIKEFPAFTPLIKFTIGNLVEIHGVELERLVAKMDGVYYNPAILDVPEWIEKLGGNYTYKDFFSDGVHPSELTYQEWGKDFANFIVINNVIQN
ncbi:SGNH/GDSL hydrolase family protein [Portibacter lacus]|uniref:SGNH hydrolase-type esterase domain-containing protein n=1 Tax=Portibacter lacus TaxID=1099794 RepID=A0AA37WF68_9BACT|nr:SGNH/GDSL hydrolase family protein [Portibacter lacus]GLR17474.1 hypothetical protein GCM10007940_20890 [Portibacter lacus]